ncbi:MAG: hypothetical protein IH998_01075, partial [Proteobacteria bacterium]|nr:hypothetical protein [Pseudomonadota bacterium]
MASSAAPLFDARTIADRWIADYCAAGSAEDALRARAAGDVLCARAAGDAAWPAVLEELARLA